jgi:predicted Ser/Thr protein kinase
MIARLIRLPSGAVIDGWHVLKELGDGGFAVVYLVEKGGQLRALKVARHRDASGDDKQTHARVMRELTVLLMLDHPNIIRHRGYGYAESGNVYLALDYVDGWTLGEWKERKHPTLHEILRVFVKIADALVYMHSRGILHRDLKLANVLIRKTDGEPVIIDFSCATYTQAADLTESGLPPGTDRFRAPEQFRFLREHRDEHRGRYAFQVADEIFAVGAMLYELLTDPRPTEARPRESLNNPAAMPPPARGLNPRVPEALSDLVESVLSRDPKRRPVDTEALRRELAELEADSGADYQSPAHPPSEQRQRDELHPPSKGVGNKLRALRGRLVALARSGWGIAAGAVAAVVLAAVVALWMLPGAPTHPRAAPTPPPVTAAPDMSPAPAPVAGTGPALAPEQKEGATVKTQPTEDPKQARRQKTPPGSGVSKALALGCALATGCTGPQVRPEPFTCPEGAQRAMRELHWNDGDQLSLVIDDRHDQWGHVWLRPGDTVVGIVPENARNQKAAPPGTRFLGGKVYVVPEKTADGDPGRIVVRYERAKLPQKDEVPVCVVVDTQAFELKDGAARTSNRDAGTAVNRWP